MFSLTDQQTRQRDELLSQIARLGRVGVAFSGGVDSAVVARAAREACGDRAVALTAVSPSLATGEWEEAQRQAQEIGIRHQRVETTEFTDPTTCAMPQIAAISASRSCTHGLRQWHLNSALMCC